ncbi:acyltransferase family protein [Temperatibacter marinus]|uniref:Acyltransferase family protein n=1 Tax=Temperatibacter marinus TaxID=1456591 RepID=A0AA52EGX5_9PROT|nr:acyltransferase family protein [Temperatibacter marinus]WND02943.1 acyltransferase family protein [Temperatibacter marinus]
MSTIETQRIHALDGLRGTALLLGVVFHAILTFMPGDQPFWFIMDPSRSEFLAGTGWFLHIFRMTLFFLLAGYFGRMLMEREGLKGFAKNRVMRIVVPFGAFWWIIFLAVISIFLWGFAVQNGGEIPADAPPPPPLSVHNVPLTHLWFLYLLILLYAGLVGMRALLNLVGLSRPLSAIYDAIQGRLLATPFMPFILAVPTGLAFMAHQHWAPWFGIPTPDYGLFPNTTALIAYGSAILVGWNMHRIPNLVFKLEKVWMINGAIAIVLSGYALSIVGVQPSWGTPLPEQEKMIYVICYALSIWFWTFALIGAALKFWQKESAVRRYIADASYWVYIIHLPIVMALQVALYHWSLAAELKVILILLISTPLMFLSYHYLVRYTALGKFLNGRKRTRSA